jgi:integrase
LGRDENGLVFADIEGQLIDPRNFSRRFVTLVRRAKLPPVTFHGLRHTHLTHLLQLGENPKVVSERAGHASVSITLDLYAHVLPGMQERAAERTDAALRTALEQTR